MPRLIRNGQIIEDTWLPANPESDQVAPGQIATLTQWQSLADKRGTAVQLEPGESPGPLYGELDQLALVTIKFPVFTRWARVIPYAETCASEAILGNCEQAASSFGIRSPNFKRCGFGRFSAWPTKV